LHHLLVFISENLAIPLGRDKFISDLVITIDQEVKFTNYINEKINKAYGVLERDIVNI